MKSLTLEIEKLSAINEGNVDEICNCRKEIAQHLATIGEAHEELALLRERLRKTEVELETLRGQHRVSKYRVRLLTLHMPEAPTLRFLKALTRAPRTNTENILKKCDAPFHHCRCEVRNFLLYSKLSACASTKRQYFNEEMTCSMLRPTKLKGMGKF